MSDGDTNGGTALHLIKERNEELLDELKAKADSGKHDPTTCIKLFEKLTHLTEDIYASLQKLAKESGKKMTLNLGPGKSFSFPASEWGKVVIGILVIYIVMRMHGFKPEKMVGMEAQSAEVEQVQSK